MATSKADVRRAVRAALQRAQNVGLTPAIMGKNTGVGTWDFDVPGGRGLKYVSVLQGDDGITVMQCVNEAGVADTGDLPIWIKKTVGARWAIDKERFDA